MWKYETGHKVQVAEKKADDDWETDGEVINISEKEQRWAKGKEVQSDVPLAELAAKTRDHHDSSKLNEYQTDSFARGYGGKYGVTKQMDKSAVGFNEKDKAQPNQKEGSPAAKQ